MGQAIYFLGRSRWRSTSRPDQSTDSTFSPPIALNLFNLDETRIPSWGLRTLYTVKPETNTTFEFFALPGALETPKQRVDEFVGTNDTTDRTVKYGRWS